ncbi:heterokaryon incompatibility protein-domain-containing protein, partial [Epithele typhae]|uniref:heterokaryon incompatibility protein-domain-containing protein n=1 Tax=Epithele typhae TaxID=378194 RepID=UPI00200760EA
MWLLTTDRAELHFFAIPEDVPDEYAILSHVWNKPPLEPEMSFQDIEYHQRRCQDTGDHPRDTLPSEKLKGALAFAERNGYGWLWADMCCINKTSSTELSEAINSMYRYYAAAGVCYAYFFDVSSSQPAPAWLEEFWNSEWHERGWTLQELVAPKDVLFFARDWTVLGNKMALAEVLQLKTRVPKEVLRMQKNVRSVSVAQRMSWAAGRRTTRAEDKAYSLMGIFGVHFVPIYGERDHAFMRLQEQIMKSSTDMSLFAW